MGQVITSCKTAVDFIGEALVMIGFNGRSLIVKSNFNNDLELANLEFCFSLAQEWLIEMPNLDIYIIDYGTRTIHFNNILNISKLERELLPGISLKGYFENFSKIPAT